MMVSWLWTATEGGILVFFGPRCGLMEGHHYDIFGIVLESQNFNLVSIFDPKTFIWGTLGLILAPLGSVLVACGTPGGPKGYPGELEVDF